MFYSKIEHRLFNQLIKGKLVVDKLREVIAREYQISGRKANSMVRRIKGRIYALAELKSYELSNLQMRQESIIEKIASIAEKLKILKEGAGYNELSEKELTQLRYLKGLKHRLSQKLNRLTQQIKNFDKNSSSLCFGTKRLFRAQFHLEENGYSNHADWLKAWRKARANNWYFVGAGAEKLGNQNCQYDISTGTLKIRKDTDKLEHLVLKEVNFQYGAEDIRRAIDNKQALTCTILRKKHRYYLHITVDTPAAKSIPATNGTIGLDYNVGFIQQCNVTSDGNIACLKRHDLPPKDKKALSEIKLRTVIKQIVADAKAALYSISIEKLNFRKKKSKINKSTSKNKVYNKMINSFDYARYMEFIGTECYKQGVELIKVKPYKTTITGKSKYSKIKGLNGHQAASYVIGRKGIGLTD